MYMRDFAFRPDQNLRIESQMYKVPIVSPRLGASINYVDKKGEEGVSQNVNDTTYVSICSKLVNEEGQNPQNIVNVFYECPLSPRVMMECMWVNI